jgi:hypothetical protein
MLIYRSAFGLKIYYDFLECTNAQYKNITVEGNNEQYDRNNVNK